MKTYQHRWWDSDITASLDFWYVHMKLSSANKNESFNWPHVSRAKMHFNTGVSPMLECKTRHCLEQEDESRRTCP